jgi:hypothetical protein
MQKNATQRKNYENSLAYYAIMDRWADEFFPVDGPIKYGNATFLAFPMEVKVSLCTVFATELQIGLPRAIKLLSQYTLFLYI